MANEEARRKTATKNGPKGTKTVKNASTVDSKEKKAAPEKETAKNKIPDKKPEKKPNKKDKAAEARTRRGPSESWNIIMPYVLTAIGALLALLYIIVFIGKLASGVGDGGAVGDFLQNLFSWVSGWASYAAPAALFVVAFRWRKVTAMGKTHGGLWVQFASILILLSSIFELLFGDLALTWAGYGEALKVFDMSASTLPGGFIGGFVALVMRWALRQVFSAIVLIVVFLIVTMFFIGLTPEVIFRKMKENHEYNREKRAEYLREVEEARRAESEAAEAERRAAEAAKQEEERLKKEEAAIRRVREREDKRRAEEAKLEEERLKILEEEKQREAEQIEAERAAEERAAEERAEAERAAEAEAAARAEAEAAKAAPAPEEDDHEPPFDVDDGETPSAKPYISATDLDFSLDEESAKKARPRTKLDGDDELMGAYHGADKAEDDTADELAEEGTGVEIPESTADDMPSGEPEYVYPPTALLTEGETVADVSVYADEIEAKKAELAATLRSFGIRFRSIEYSRGPTITRYEIQPEPGQRVKAIQNLMDDIALNMAVSGVRFEPSISGKSAVGIEVPNATRETVTLRSLVESETFTSESSKLTACLGADITGKPVVFDVSKMPHLLVAGATGMGKSVCINSVIVSLMYKATPEELRLILIDPKKVEFAIYRDMPHLLTPIITDPQKAAGALCSAVSEMEKRFELIERVGARDIKGYKKITAGDPDMPRMFHIVIIIDELADLMMTASNDVEAAIMRLAQKARAAGIHLIIGTQRPSVDVITGTIKANIPSRIACTVASQTDSRTILDAQGAEKLCGRGDMLFAPVGTRPKRVQGSFVSDDEVIRVVNFMINNNGTALYDEQFMENINIEAERCASSKKASAEAAMVAEGGEDKFDEAVRIAIESGKIATSLLQRRLSIGYGRAAKIIDQMEQMGYVGAAEGTKPRKVLITLEEYLASKEDAGAEE